MDQIGLSPGVVHHHLGGGVADHDQPVARAGGPIDQAPVEVAAGNGDAAGDLLLDQLEVSVLHQPGRHAVMGQGADLGVRVGGVAKALDDRQDLVVAIGALERAGLDGLQEHGAAGGEAGAIALGQLG
jgi:hypothetical protein